MTIKRGGHTFAGVDKPIRTPNHKSGKSHAVVIKQGDGFKLIRFGMQGAKTKPPRKRKSVRKKPEPKPLSATVIKTLERKANNSKFTLGQLKAVYRRGQGAYLGGGSRNVTMQAWAMGRVNSFITGKGGARKADADLLR